MGSKWAQKFLLIHFHQQGLYMLHLGLHEKRVSDFYSLKPLSLLVGATGFEPTPGWVDFIDVSERL
jgi:hypothetical protein